MKTLTIRGIEHSISKKLKKLAEEEKTSINQTVIKILKNALGVDEKKPFKEYHDLDTLAGTWNEKDYNEFTNNIKDFSKIDKDLWK